MGKIKKISDHLFFINRSNILKTSIYCKYCKSIIVDHNDSECMKKYNCCHDCYLYLIEPRKLDYKSGWRPSSDDIKKLIEKYN